MLSSFIALAAGLIGGVDVSPAPATAPIESAVAAPAPTIGANIERVLQAEETPETPLLVEVQDAQPEPAPDTASAGTEIAKGETVAPDIDAPAAETLVVPPAASQPAQRQADPSVLSMTERRAVLRAASDAMSRVETASGRFVQVDATGSLSEGNFFLQRPGRMRFEYDDPVPILIAADGVTVAMRDEELETVDRVPLAATPLGLLLDDSLDFETEADVIRVQRANGIVAITVVDPTDEAEGELTLIFNAGSYDLLAWRVLDANGGLTTVELQDVTTGMTLNPRLFIVDDFEDEDDDRRR